MATNAIALLAQYLVIEIQARRPRLVDGWMDLQGKMSSVNSSQFCGVDFFVTTNRSSMPYHVDVKTIQKIIFVASFSFFKGRELLS